MTEEPASEEDGEVSNEKDSPIPPPPPPPGLGFPPPPNEAPPPPLAADMPINEPPSDNSDDKIEDVLDAESAMATLRGLNFGENLENEDFLVEKPIEQSSELSQFQFETEGIHESEKPPPPPGFPEPEPQGDEVAAPPPPPPGFPEPEPQGDIQISSIDSLAESLSLFNEEDQSESLEPNQVQIISDSEDLQTNPFSSISEVAQAIDTFGLVRESEISEPESQMSSRPSPFLRNSSEIDSIPGDKLHATLSETEKAVLNPDGSIRKQFIDGELILRNSSKKHRAWDIEVHLESIESTDFGDKISSVKELDPTEETAIPYTASGPRMILLKESIDTENSRDEEPSLSLVYSESPQEVEINIQIENVSPAPIFDVEVKRTIPESFELPEDRDYSVEQDSVVWDIGRMNIGEVRNLSISAKVYTHNIEKINAGVTSATYSAEATASRARFDRVHGSGRQFSYVNAEEDDRPGVWHCTCVFENKSSFVVSLSGATVRLIGREEPILDVSDIRQDVPPEGKWDSMVKRVESEDQPSFTQEIRFSILPRVSVQSTGTVELKEQQLTVLDAVLQKRFDKSRIKSYITSNVDATVTLENTGTSEINVIRILDDIPGIFDTPSLEDVTIEMEGSELNEDQYRIDVVNGTQIEEKHTSPDGEGHGFRITIGTSAPLGLQPGKAVLIRYPLKAPDPSPRNKMLVAPIKVDFSSERFGPVASRMVERLPMIKVVHKRRNISTGKEVFPGGKPGQYEIMLMFHNSSDSALEDLALHDIVPGTFSIEESTVRSDKEGQRDASITKESARDGTQVTWAVGRIQQGERIEVLYTIQGDPEAEYKVSDAQDFHGSTFGDEVDEEPNVPEWMEVENADSPSTSKESLSESVLDSEGYTQRDDSQDEIKIKETNLEEDIVIEDEKEEIKSKLETSPAEKNLCQACGFEVGIGTSICPVCGNTLA